MCVVLAAMVSTAPFLPGVATTGAAAAPDPLRVIQFNARSDNGEIGRAAAFIRAMKPDVILVEEARDGPGQIAEQLDGDYPVRVSCLFLEWEGGLLVFSRWPAIAGEPALCSADSRLAAVRLLVRGTPVTFASLHLKWPWPVNQAGHIDRLSPLLAALPHPLVLGGDFNAAPWSHAVDRVAGLTQTRVVPAGRSRRAAHAASPWPRRARVPGPRFFIRRVRVVGARSGAAAGDVSLRGAAAVVRPRRRPPAGATWMDRGFFLRYWTPRGCRSVLVLMVCSVLACHQGCPLRGSSHASAGHPQRSLRLRAAPSVARALL